MIRNKVLCFLVLILLISCKHEINFEKRIHVIMNLTDKYDDLWLFTLTNYLIGVDSNTAETKLCVELPVGIEAPVFVNNKFYVSETNVFGWKNRAGVIVLDSNLKFQKEIEAYPNIKKTSVYNDFLFCDCMSWDLNGNSGFSIIDLKSDTLVFKYNQLPDLIVNQNNACWGYNGKVYLGTEYETNLETPFSITIVNTNPLEIIERTEMFSSDFPFGERTSVLVNKNQLWVCYRFKDYICVYDLDTNKKIASIDLRNFIPETINEPFEQIWDSNGHTREWNNFNLLHQNVYDGVYYSVITNYGGTENGAPFLNAILGINTSTFQLCFLTRFDEDLQNFDEYRFSANNKDIIFLRKFNHIYEYSISQEKLLNELIVFEK